MKAIDAGPILLVEDNAVNQRVTIAMLENLGFHVDIAADGIDAVNAAAMVPYQAILMDCQLPRMDGFQATTEIRRWCGASRATPIIAVTSADKDSDRRRCIEAGMDDYLSKPITQRALADVLARWAPDASIPETVTILDEPVVLDLAEPVAILDVLDPEVVERLERLGAAAGEDLMGQLTILFLADADDRVLELTSALAGADAGAVFRSAHAFTGASANIGASDLARLCTKLAARGEARELGDGDALLAAIEAELRRVRSTLESRSLTP